MTNESLDELRQRLDSIDTELVKLLDRRYETTDRVAEYKNRNNVGLVDTQREQAIISRLSSIAEHPALSEVIPDLYERIITANKKYRSFMRHADLPVSTIGVIGLGLIGGSIAKAIHAKQPTATIHTVSRVRSDRKKAPYIKEHDSIESLTNTCDCIMICTPIDDVITTARSIAASHNGKNTLLVMDVASVKSAIAEEFQNLTTDCLEFIASHPMAGSDKSGFDAAKSLLFVQMPWVITPHDRNTREPLATAEGIVRFMGSTPITTPAADHDIYTAAISHFIFLLSTYVYAFIQDMCPQALAYAGSGFMSVTRLASANAEMHEQIMRHNKSNISDALKTFGEYIQRHPLNNGSTLEFFSTHKQERDAFIKKREE